MPEIEHPVLFEGSERGTGLVAPTTLRVDQEGLYWFDVMFEDTMVTRIPLRILYQMVAPGRGRFDQQCNSLHLLHDRSIMTLHHERCLREMIDRLRNYVECCSALLMFCDCSQRGAICDGGLAGLKLQCFCARGLEYCAKPCRDDWAKRI